MPPDQIQQLATKIADRIFTTNWDREARDSLVRLLLQFAHEIKRSAEAA